MSSVFSDDLRLACMATSDHVLFMEPKLGHNIGGCPPDEVEVHGGDELDKHQIIVLFWFMMCQKRLCIMHSVRDLLLRLCGFSVSLSCHTDDNTNPHSTYLQCGFNLDVLQLLRAAA